MAKEHLKSVEHEHEPEQQQQAAPASSAPTVSSVPDERYRKITLDDPGSTFAYGDGSHSGQTINRVDFIRQAWVGARQSRGAIAKEVSRLVGKKVTYQIIFAATKGVAGGPPSQTPTPVAPATSTPAA